MTTKPFDHDKARNAHMKRRKESAGMSHREVASEFATSKSTSHRRIGSAKPAPKNTMKWDKSKKPAAVKTDRGKFGFR